MSYLIRRQWTKCFLDEDSVPIPDPFEPEELHRGASADLVGVLVQDLDEVAIFVALEESGFAGLVLDRKILNEEIRISFRVRSVFLEPGHDSSMFAGVVVPFELGRYLAVFILRRGFHSRPIIIKCVVHKNKF